MCVSPRTANIQSTRAPNRSAPDWHVRSEPLHATALWKFHPMARHQSRTIECSHPSQYRRRGSRSLAEGNLDGSAVASTNRFTPRNAREEGSGSDEWVVRRLASLMKYFRCNAILVEVRTPCSLASTAGQFSIQKLFGYHFAKST